MSKNFRGTFTVMITPCNAEGAIDLTALADFTEWQIRQGIHGLIPLGSTGEYDAQKGWDACTGWGTPRGKRLLNALRPRRQ